MIPFEFVETVDKLELKNVEPNELVRRVLTGCKDSATELSTRFTPRLLILLERRLSGNRTDAEDIAQESLARAFLHLEKFDFGYQFSTWLYTIAFRLATDFNRKQKRRPKLIAMEGLQDNRAFATTPTPTNSLSDASDVWQLARSILLELPYTILWLKYGEGMSIKEIASVVQKTQIVVRVQLHRARGKLSQEIRRRDREQQLTRPRNEPNQ